MADPNDIDLVLDYAHRNSEPAFAELVRRHINLVYSVALRFTSHPEDAEDVTQAVFVILAQKARGLSPKTILTGWLYETTRFTAKRFLRTQASRQLREQKAYMETVNDSNSESVWRQLAPLLEEAMSRLSEKERTLIALRFYENKSALEIATLLGIQEWAARKRAERTLAKLRKLLTKRGIISTDATIASEISANSVQAAPVALVKTATAIALAKGTTASASTLTLVKGTLKIMAWTKAKTAVIASVCVLLLAGTGAVIIVKSQSNRAPSGNLSQDALEQENPVEHYVLHTPLTQTDDQLRNALVGKWKLVGAKSMKTGKFVVLDPNNHFFKSFTLTTWATTNYDSSSNVVDSAGGPFSLHGEVTTETIETATGSKSEFLGAHVHFRIRVVGDDYYQMGSGSPASVEQQWHRISE